MRLLKRLFLMAAVALALCVVCTKAYAFDMPDLSRKGSVSVAMTYEGACVPGGALTLYRVGNIVRGDGGYSFELADPFAASNVALGNLDSPEAADELAGYARNQGVSGAVQDVDADGKASFANMEPGLYLMAQTQAARGYYPIDPFLISVPQVIAGAYVYEVDASPKLELKKAPVPPVSTVPIPETGENFAPMVICGACGVALCVAGGTLHFFRKSKRGAPR